MGLISIDLNFWLNIKGNKMNFAYIVTSLLTCITSLMYLLSPEKINKDFFFMVIFSAGLLLIIVALKGIEGFIEGS